MHIRMMNVFRSTLGLMVLATVAFSIACGSDGAAASDPVISEESVPMLHSDKIYTIDDVSNAGWKKSKEISTETLNGASEAWYGFSKQKDLEIWVYPSNASAIADGVPPADAATGRGKPKPFAEGGISSTRTAYGAYAIVGNLVILCETDVADCLGLIEQLP